MDDFPIETAMYGSFRIATFDDTKTVAKLLGNVHSHPKTAAVTLRIPDPRTAENGMKRPIYRLINYQKR
jgi:hypothetical protein